MSREQKSELERERERERERSVCGGSAFSSSRPIHHVARLLAVTDLLLLVRARFILPRLFHVNSCSLFLNPDRSDRYRIYIFTVYWPAANTRGLYSLCWGEKWGWTEGEKGWKQSRTELTRKMTCVRVKVYHQREASTLKIWWKHNQGFYHRWLSPKRFWFKIPICIWIALNRHFNGGGGGICFTHYGSTNSASISTLHNPVQPNDKNTFFLVNLHLQQLKRSARHYTICCYSSSYLTAVSLCIYLSGDVLTRKKYLSNG